MYDSNLNLNIQQQVKTLNNIKTVMLRKASKFTTDTTTLKDLEGIIDGFAESFLIEHHNKYLSPYHVEEYSMMMFQDIANGYENYANRLYAVMGPTKRFLMCIAIYKTKRRVALVASLAKKVLV